METLLKLRNKHKIVSQALEDCNAIEINQPEEIEKAVQKIDEKYEEILKQAKPFDSKKSKEYKRFKEKLKEIFDSARVHNQSLSSKSGDGDILLEEAEINTLDPLTKVAIKSPVRNRHCGHYYEKESITAILKVKNKIKCPVAGCGNQHFLKINDLVADSVFKKKLQDIYSKQQLES